ncbi:MAG: hypothetical protein JWO71_2829 [Candidatus Acidoferrum typicum]|nr:hypothetical protein [Candidatus Acidoferrum typicum]
MHADRRKFGEHPDRRAANRRCQQAHYPYFNSNHHCAGLRDPVRIKSVKQFSAVRRRERRCSVF